MTVTVEQRVGQKVPFRSVVHLAKFEARLKQSHHRTVDVALLYQSSLHRFHQSSVTLSTLKVGTAEYSHCRSLDV